MTDWKIPVQIRVSLDFDWSRLESLVYFIDLLVKLQYGRDVSASLAVVGGRPNGDQSLLEHFLESLHDQLMGPNQSPQTILFHEFPENVWTEEKPGPSAGLLPTRRLVRIGPHQIADESLVGDLCDPLDQS